MKSYQGHRSWNAWNVTLWINNDENLYRFALKCIEKGKRNGGIERAVKEFMLDVGETTPDGAVYNRLSVKLALQGLEE